MTKRVLITGAGGFTGSVLRRLLGEVGWAVVPMDVQVEGGVSADFCDPGFGRVLSRLEPVDAVVHLGTRVGWDGASRADLFRPNVLATGQLAAWAAEKGAYFVFASAALIAGERETYITSGMGVNTRNDYLYGKWLAEELIRMSGVSHCMLRISGIFGHNGPAHLGLNRAVSGALEGHVPVRYGDGKIKRNYIYVHDLCLTIKHCLENRLEGIHLTAGAEANSLADMLQTICDVFLPGKSPEVRPGGGSDQVVEASSLLPGGRTFRAALEDILKEINPRR